MDDFPNNSSRGKQQPVPVPAEEPEIDTIVSEGVTVKKPSRLKRFRRSFIAGDASSVGEHVFWNLLLPAAKDALSDMGSTFIDMMIYGEKRVHARNPAAPAQGLGSNSKINYGGISTGSRVVFSPAQAAQDPVNQGRFSPNDIQVPTRAQAEAIIAKMFDVLEKYKVVTVAQLYSMVNITPDYPDYKWGWTNLDSADIKRVRNGVLLVLPPPIDLGH